MIKVQILSIPVEEGGVRREGCKRRMTKLFELGGVLKELMYVHIIHIMKKWERKNNCN